jgi:hypothetical protein
MEIAVFGNASSKGQRRVTVNHWWRTIEKTALFVMIQDIAGQKEQSKKLAISKKKLYKSYE